MLSWLLAGIGFNMRVLFQYDYTRQKLTIKLWYEDFKWCSNIENTDSFLRPRAPPAPPALEIPKLKGYKSVPKRRKSPTGELLTQFEAAALPPPLPKRRKYQLSPEEITWDVSVRTAVPPPEKPIRKYQLV